MRKLSGLTSRCRKLTTVRQKSLPGLSEVITRPLRSHYPGTSICTVTIRRNFEVFFSASWRAHAPLYAELHMLHYMQSFMSVYIHTREYVAMCMCVYVCVCTCHVQRAQTLTHHTHTHKHTHTHTHTHTHIRIHMHVKPLH
jgi:hypothetical protein